MESLNNLPPGMAKPAVRALTEAKIESLEQLAAMTEADLSKLHGIGPRALQQLREALAYKGMAFKEE
ncbi:helix-hairpin-helix domain-containing protein [Sporosarcina sp. 179-K 3D1 HS]|uniref:helix-hairpin-helix domain-containing protein n=1 Tax=Sporosarcina sp. 179-K 3D1 HS TaxID=3232169 RepID=UPI0039A327C0